jgi:Cu/Ag efflux protein CusF
MRTLFRSLTLLLVLICAAAPFSFAQKPAPKSYVFKGKVESVGQKGLMVANEKIEGWMDAMTMMYAVDKPEVLKKVKAGDQIKATVYDGDYTLHDVQVVPSQQKK